MHCSAQSFKFPITYYLQHVKCFWRYSTWCPTWKSQGDRDCNKDEPYQLHIKYERKRDWYRISLLYSQERTQRIDTSLKMKIYCCWTFFWICIRVSNCYLYKGSMQYVNKKRDLGLIANLPFLFCEILIV